MAHGDDNEDADRALREVHELMQRVQPVDLRVVDREPDSRARQVGEHWLDLVVHVVVDEAVKDVAAFSRFLSLVSSLRHNVSSQSTRVLAGPLARRFAWNEIPRVLDLSVETRLELSVEARLERGADARLMSALA